MKKFLFFLFGALVISFISCKDEIVPKTKTQLLTQGTWKFKMATANGTDVSNQNPPFSACRKDNILTFEADGDGNINESTLVCSPSEASTFTWSFTNGETILNVSSNLYGSNTNDFTINSLTETQLVLQTPYTFGAIVVQVIITFEH